MISSSIKSNFYFKIKSFEHKEDCLTQSNNLMIDFLRRESNLTKASLNETYLRHSKSKSSLSYLKYQKSEAEILNKKRKDVFGNEILKGSKEHKISFIDQISSQKIAEIVLIDLNNQYNNCKNDNNKDLCQCTTCIIF